MCNAWLPWLIPARLENGIAVALALQLYFAVMQTKCVFPGAFKIITAVFNQSVSRMVFRAWHAVAVDARKTREYFERLERGELDDDGETDGDVPSENFR